MKTPGTGTDSLHGQLQALRVELAELRETVLEIHALLHHLVGEAALPEPPSRLSSTPSQTLSRRHPQRLAAEVQRRTALLSVEELAFGDGDTELDLLIDRLHDLALEHPEGS
jgi:hypothetical protein